MYCAMAPVTTTSRYLVLGHTRVMTHSASTKSASAGLVAARTSATASRMDGSVTLALIVPVRMSCASSFQWSCRKRMARSRPDAKTAPTRSTSVRASRPHSICAYMDWNESVHRMAAVGLVNTL
jgi:hypothetical protein